MKKLKRKAIKPSDFDEIATNISQNILRDIDSSNNLLYSRNRYAFDLYKKNQHTCILKKYISVQEGSKVEDEKTKETYKKFHSINNHMAKYSDGNLCFPAAHQRVVSSLPTRSKLLLRARSIARQILKPFTWEQWFEECKNSSGSTIGVPFIDTSDERKFVYPITCTERVQPLASYYLDFDKSLGTSIAALNLNNSKEKFAVVDGSRATTVAKSDKIRRMIAVEPTWNMFFQQGLMAIMYKRLKSFGLDLTTLPDTHKILAREGSISGNLATIDFTSASDCVSLDLLRWILPPEWFNVVDLLRSSSITIDGKNCSLNMASTMGNAVTFPLETLVFYCLANACHLESTGTNRTLLELEEHHEVSVFGDDCIVPTRYADMFINICEEVGFIVNKEKSFYDKYYGFRESCGGDYYRGIDIRPIYIGPPTGPRFSDFEPWLYIIMNKVIKKYITYFGPLSYVYERNVFKYYSEVCRKFGLVIKLVPNYFPDDSGLKMAFDIDRFCRYGFDFEKIKFDRQKGYRFKYHSFQFCEESDRDPSLRLSLWIKKPHVTDPWCKVLAPTEKYLIRKRGGYVVSAKWSSCWTPGCSKE